MNSSQGGGSKDTWAVADDLPLVDQRVPAPQPVARPGGPTVPLQFGPADDHERHHQQALQQQTPP